MNQADSGNRSGSVNASDDVEPSAFDELWNRLARPFDVIHTVSAITGLSPTTVSHLVGLKVAASAEAQLLLTSMPTTVRSLATSIQTSAERCIGQLRGPVLWSETMSARASSFGDPDLFICSTPSRAYDIAENQVLVAALNEVHRAATLADARVQEYGSNDPLVDADLIHEASHARLVSGRFLDHPSLRDVERKRPNGRSIKRTRSGKHRATYGPALELLAKAAEPLDAADVAGWCDQRTLAQIRTLTAIMRLLEGRGGRLPEIRVEKGALYSGPIQYYHPPADMSREVLSGIVIGQLLVDVPYDPDEADRERAEELLRSRSGRRHTMVIMDDDDIDHAVERAIELARGVKTAF